MTSAATHIGPYSVVRELGRGGMGVVYLATDTRLDRQVAIKGLPEPLTSDSDRLARFQREAKVLASLNHPNIGAIYGIEEANGQQYLVLEYIEGETLDQRLIRGPLPIDDAIEIAIHIADALESAHEKGVIHRDLKPGNIMVTPDGTVKVLDFGLARSSAITSSMSPLTDEDSPTLIQPDRLHSPTMPGVILGTAGYMSPEQARGKSLDKRSDIFSFGCVLYEMLTAARPFAGESVSDTIPALLRGDPSWEALPATTPPALRRLLARCLQKDLDRRLRDIGDARLELEDAGAEPEGMAGFAQGAAAPATRRRGRWAVVIAAVSMLLALVLILERSLQPGGEDRSVEFEINAPPGTSFSTWRRGRPVISPDGRRVVFSAVGSSGERLWVRSLDSLEARPLPGTEEGVEPFWSADSRHVAFTSFSRLALRRVDVNGGPPRLLTEWWTFGGTWNGADEVLLSSLWQSLYRASAAGQRQRPQPLTTLDASRQEIWHAEPQFLPDGEHFLFFVDSREAEHTGTYVASLTSPDSRHQILAGAKATYADPGYLLFTQGGSLFARRFDVERLQPVGDPEVVIERVAVLDGKALFSTSSNGTLAYRVPFASDAQFTWFDRRGNSLGVLSLPEGAQSPELSPNDKLLAFERIDPETGWRDIWLWDFARGVSEKLTNHPSNDSDPVWAADGRSIIYSSMRNGYPSIHRRRVGSSAAPEMIRDAKGEDWPSSWSRDGQHVIYMRWSAEEPLGKLMVLSLSGDAEPTPLLGTGSEEVSGQFSPDGKWVAYVTSESGRREVYVEPFPRTGERRRVSAAGGSEPRWRGDSEELYYIDPELKLMAVAISFTRAGLRPSAPQELFQMRISGGTGVGVRFNYAVSRDGRRFLINTDSGQRRPSPIVVVLNWTARLQR